MIEVDGEVAGWVDVDPEPGWLGENEANIGWAVLPHHRGHGLAAEALQQLVTRHVAVAIVEDGNAASHRTAANAGFDDTGPFTAPGRRPSRRYVRRPTVSASTNAASSTTADATTHQGSTRPPGTAAASDPSIQA